MRTTVTLESDVELKLQELMRQRGITFKEAINGALRSGLGLDGAREPYDFPTYHMGVPRIDLTHALQVASAMEDEEIARKMALGK